MAEITIEYDARNSSAKKILDAIYHSLFLKLKKRMINAHTTRNLWRKQKEMLKVPVKSSKQKIYGSEIFRGNP